MENISFGNVETLSVESFFYDPSTDKITFMYISSDPTEFKNDLIDIYLAEPITIDSINTFEGYTKVSKFFARYDSENDYFECHVDLERDETQFQKLVNRVAVLENGTTELRKATDMLARVNAEALSKINNNTPKEIDLEEEISLLDETVKEGGSRE